MDYPYFLIFSHKVAIELPLQTHKSPKFESIDPAHLSTKIEIMTLQTGDSAPDFTLTTLGPDGPALVNLSQITPGKKTVLLFFPMAFTGGCTTEMCEVSTSLDRYTELGAQVFAVSGDNPFAQAAWAEKEGITVPLLSDYEHQVAEQWGVAYDSFLPDKNLTMGGVTKRSAFVIDGEGVIRYAEVNDNPGQNPDFEAIQSILADLS